MTSWKIVTHQQGSLFNRYVKITHLFEKIRRRATTRSDLHTKATYLELQPDREQNEVFIVQFFQGDLGSGSWTMLLWGTSQLTNTNFYLILFNGQVFFWVNLMGKFKLCSIQRGCNFANKIIYIKILSLSKHI